ncbi:hypothetical protein [Longimicrobium sp.]|uniref:hypothetical protein n=1 Tax=Longimicrobium sp. TaxID=2029185 RepID=UPI002E34D82F|nr:hypothetical protein [Longimicrobium sp.]HEX6040385.1 hypothetical protein [Longimicrobium sp.]
MHPFIRRIIVPACALAAAAPAHAQPADASALSGRWTGTYECPQGVTALDLDLRGNAYGIVQGTFQFSPTPENPEVPAGSYPVMGRFTGAALVLRPIDAREMPAGYGPVGIQATVNGRRMAGLILGPGCGAMAVTRAQSAAPDAPLPGGYGQQRWEVIGQNERERLSVEVAPDTMGTHVTRAWMRWEALQDNPENGDQAGTETNWEVEMDCEGGLVRVWRLVQYDPEGRIEFLEDSAPYTWEAINESSLFDFVFEHVCRGGMLPEKG